MNSVLKSWCFLKPVITSVIHTLISAITNKYQAPEISEIPQCRITKRKL